MKIGRIVAADGGIATSVVLGDGAAARALDVTQAARAFGEVEEVGSLDAIIAGGLRLRDAVERVVERARRNGEAVWFAPADAVSWALPCVPATFLCAGRNFGRHRDEADNTWAKRGGAKGQSEIPTGFVKVRGSLVPHGATVRRPPGLDTLDYEAEVAAILGTPVKDVPEERALDAVFGYTVFNDFSAREWQFHEMQNRLMLIGKNFPGAGPFGPWILTADEVPDPTTLGIELRVNGRVRQHIDDCSDMLFGFAQLIAFWSLIGLEAGDAIASGTPEGVSHARPDPENWYLKPGDMVETEVPQIGVLKTLIA